MNKDDKNYLRTVEMSTEQNYNMIDGVITDENDTVIQVESLPDELREIAIVAYMNNSDMPKEELKDILASALELTPQASDIHTKTEIKEDTVIFSRASQKEYAAVASEKPASQNTEKIRANYRHAKI